MPEQAWRWRNVIFYPGYIDKIYVPDFTTKHLLFLQKTGGFMKGIILAGGSGTSLSADNGHFKTTAAGLR